MAHFLLDTGEILTFNGKLTIYFQSPLLTELNTHSLSGYISFTPEHSRILDRPELINSADNKEREFACTFVAKGFNLVGSIIVTEANDKGYKYKFVGQGDVNYILNNTRIKDVDTSEEYTRPGGPIRVNGVINGYYLYEDICCMPMYYNFVQYDTLPIIKSVEYNREQPANNSYIDSGELYYSSFESMFFTLRHTFKTLLTKSGLNVTDYALSKSIFDHVLIYNNNSNGRIEWELHDTYNVPAGGTIEKIDQETFSLTVQMIGASSGEAFNEGDFIRIYRVSSSSANYLVNSIFKIKEMISVVNDVYTFTINANTSRLLYFGFNIYVQRVVWSVNFDNNKFKLNECLPDITLIELKKAIEDMFCGVLIYSESNKSVRFVLWKDILNSEKVNDITLISGTITEKPLSENDSVAISNSTDNDEWYSDNMQTLSNKHTLKDPVTFYSNLPLSNNSQWDVRYVTYDRKFYVWDTTELYTGQWVFFSKDLAIDGNDNPVQYEMESAPPVPYYNTCRVDIPLNMINCQDNSNPGVRLAMFKIVNNLPVLSTHNNNLSLELHGDNNIINKLHAERIAWRTNRYRPVKCMINWERKTLNNFPWDEKFRIKDTNYLVERIPVSFYPDDSIEFGESELVRT